MNNLSDSFNHNEQENDATSLSIVTFSNIVSRQVWLAGALLYWKKEKKKWSAPLSDINTTRAPHHIQWEIKK